MSFTLFLQEYIVWHYGEAFLQLFSVSGNFLRFGYHFFSLPLLIRTWISPWYRMKEKVLDDDGTYFDEVGAAILGNFVLRLVGFILRTVVIVLGIFFEALVLLGTVVVFVVWVLFPLLFPLLIVGILRLFI